MKYRKILMAVPMVACVIILLMVAGVAYAAAPDAAGKTQVNLNLRVAKSDSDTGVTFIAARLNSGDRPLGNQPVDFFVATDFFGQRQMRLGTGTTDATGTATIKYQPKWEGTHIITARFPGSTEYAPAEVKLSVEAPKPTALYTPEPVGLEEVSQWATVGAGVVVAVVWGLLLFIVIYVIRGIARVRVHPRTTGQDVYSPMKQSIESVS